MDSTTALSTSEMAEAGNDSDAQVEALTKQARKQTPFEIGLYSFAELTPDAVTGEVISPTQRLQNLVESIELAEEVELDVFGLGEHHRSDFVSSSPAVVLGAIAARTKRIRLSSAVTVLSSDDPVRVFQDFATLDLLSTGRAEIMAGRGSFIESFPLFGYDLHDYHDLFTEKLELLLKLRESEQINWQGRHRASLTGQGVYPRPHQSELPVWIAVGGTPESVARAARLGLPMALAIIGGMPAQFASLVELYRKIWNESGHDPANIKLSINSHGYIAEDPKTAIDEAYPSFAMMMNKIGQERGWSGSMTRGRFEASASLRGADFVGNPEQVVEKILYQHEIFGHHRMLLQLSIGTMPHRKVMRSIELLGTEVAPVVRKEIAGRLKPG